MINHKTIVSAEISFFFVVTGAASLSVCHTAKRESCEQLCNAFFTTLAQNKESWKQEAAASSDYTGQLARDAAFYQLEESFTPISKHINSQRRKVIWTIRHHLRKGIPLAGNIQCSSSDMKNLLEGTILQQCAHPQTALEQAECDAHRAGLRVLQTLTYQAILQKQKADTNLVLVSIGTDLSPDQKAVVKQQAQERLQQLIRRDRRAYKQEMQLFHDMNSIL